jgi:hypothetical protein
VKIPEGANTYHTLKLLCVTFSLSITSITFLTYQTKIIWMMAILLLYIAAFTIALLCICYKLIPVKNKNQSVEKCGQEHVSDDFQIQCINSDIRSSIQKSTDSPSYHILLNRPEKSEVMRSIGDNIYKDILSNSFIKIQHLEQSISLPYIAINTFDKLITITSKLIQNQNKPLIDKNYGAQWVFKKDNVLIMPNPNYRSLHNLQASNIFPGDRLTIHLLD